MFAVCVCVCFVKSMVSYFSLPSAPPLLTAWELSVLGRQAVEAGTSGGPSASLEPAPVAWEREGTGQRLTDGPSATRTAGRWL